MERQLGVGEQHRELRPGQGLVPAPALDERRVVRQVLHGPVEPALPLQPLHQALREADVREALPLGEGERQRLEVVVAQHQARDLVGHCDEKRVALRPAQAAVALGGGERDLDVDLDVRSVHPGRVVDGVRVEAHALPRRLDAAGLGQAEVRAFPDHLGPQSRRP